jgi:hypothetical protein
MYSKQYLLSDWGLGLMSPILGIIASSFKSGFTPPGSYDALASYTVPSGGVSSVTFAGLPTGGQYQHLQIRGILRSARALTQAGVLLRLNSDTGSNYSYTYLIGNGTTASSGRGTSTAELELFTGSAVTTANPQMQIIDIFSYAGSTNKTVLWAESSEKNGSGAVSRNVGLWRNTSAINNIQLSDSSGRNFGVGTTATLYGIKNA